jgi:hypothetical protein
MSRFPPCQVVPLARAAKSTKRARRKRLAHKETFGSSFTVVRARVGSRCLALWLVMRICAPLKGTVRCRPEG